jgi:hypothetical protein
MFLIIVIILFVYFGIVIAVKQYKVARLTRARVMSKLSKYKTQQSYLSNDDLSFVGLNFDDRRIVIGSSGREGVYNFAQISGVEMVENNTTISQTNRGSQALGAAVGGLAFGGLGALVGGLSASSRSRGRLSGIVLKVIVDDNVHPVYSICFLRYFGKKGLDRNGVIAKQALSTAERFHAHVTNAMRRASRAAPVLDAAPVQQPSSNFLLPAYCTGCGTKLKGGDSFCGSCGGRVLLANA